MNPFKIQRPDGFYPLGRFSVYSGAFRLLWTAAGRSSQATSSQEITPRKGGDLQPEAGPVPEYPGGVEVHRPAPAALIIGGDRVAVVHPAVGRDLRDQVIVDLDIPALGAVGGGPVQDAQGDEQHRHHQHRGSEGQRKAPSLLAFHRCTASLCYIGRYEYTSPGEAVPSICLTKQAGSLHCCHIRSRHWRQAKKAPAVRRGPERSSGQDYSLMSMTTPEPTVRPPSRIAKRRPFSMAMGVISSTFISTLSPGMHISVPSGRVMTPVTSVVRK